MIFILDAGTTHAPKQRKRWFLAQAGVYDLHLHFQVL